MRLLLVEDERDFAEVLTNILERIGSIVIVLAGSRDAAYQAVEESDFDLAICDLRIPPVDGSLEKSVNHGLAAKEYLRSAMPGMPVIILSAYGTPPLVRDLLQQESLIDLYGTGKKYSMVDFQEKKSLTELKQIVSNHYEDVEALESVELDSGGTSISLSDGEKRVLRIITRRLDGVIAHLEEIGGGLTDTHTLGIRVTDDRDVLKTRAFAKLGALETLQIENEAYEKFVKPIMPQGSFSVLIDQISAGAWEHGGLFYGLAEQYSSSLFELLSKGTETSVTVLDHVKTALAHWTDSSVPQSTTIDEVRRLFLSDEELGALSGKLGDLAVEEFEAHEITVRVSTQHRDLHGSNILVGGNSNPIIIDYGSVGEAPVSVDAITLELSVLFHPDAVGLCPDWPPATDAAHWADVDEYVAQCPISEFVKSCRKWARELAWGKREILAVAYGYLLRQMKYTDTDHDSARNILAGVIEAYNRT